MSAGAQILFALLAILVLIGFLSAIHRIRKRAAHGRDQERGSTEAGDDSED